MTVERIIGFAILVGVLCMWLHIGYDWPRFRKLAVTFGILARKDGE